MIGYERDYDVSNTYIIMKVRGWEYNVENY